ncbi:MAG: Unknown protein [uncultured Sulfurovum sp.]|uniref:VOC domain-containing protein n=1 Tax=uncultured Sulfurovum sp. TaxID=269237 RepID=A0A6S6TD45_9BACT|nr:MAG: Unknown protein [uncultured Sulfurovum sp.]
MQLNLLVLRCKNIETSKNFYEKLGLTFVQEQHGKGLIHYSSYVGEMVMELYPLKDGYNVENSRLGFNVELENIHAYLTNVGIEIVSEYEFDNKCTVVVIDPDDRKVELVNE